MILANNLYLAEHYKLVASPALIKIAPPPQQMIAGSDIVGQLERWWPKWQQEYQSYLTMIETRDTPNGQEAAGYFDKFDDPVSHSAEIMKLSDEIFSAEANQG